MKSSDIMPAIRTDHAAISIEISELENEQKGPGYWKMNCSMLKDEEYVNNITEMLPVWTAEGQKEILDSRILWDWIKYNIRAHAINYSKKKAKERNAIELSLQDELREAKEEYETTPSYSNATRFNAAQEKLETFYEELYVHVLVGMSMGKEHKIFFKPRKKKSYKKAYKKSSHKRSNKNRSILYIKGARKVLQKLV